MVSYGVAKARAMASRTDWNEREYIAKARITWVDEEYEYDLEIENDGMEDNEFTAWVEENAEELAREDAEAKGKVFEEVDRISFEEDYIDDDALFDDAYDAWCEAEWEAANDR